MIATEQDGASDRIGAEALADAIERRIEGGSVAIERQRELDGVVVGELAEGDADERQAVAVDQRRRRHQQPARDREDGSRLGRGLVHGVRPRRAREVVEPQA